LVGKWKAPLIFPQPDLRLSEHLMADSETGQLVEEERPQRITLRPRKWSQYISRTSDPESHSARYLCCDAAIVSPTAVELEGAIVTDYGEKGKKRKEDTLRWLTLGCELSVVAGEPVTAGGQKIEDGVGLFCFRKGFRSLDNEDDYPPSIDCWFSLQEAEFNDLWARIKNVAAAELLVALNLMGIRDKGEWETDLHWDVDKQPALTIKDVTLAFNYPAPVNFEDTTSNLRHRGWGTKSIDEALAQYLSGHLVEKPKDDRYFYSQYNTIAQTIAKSIAKYSKSIGEDSDQFEDRLQDAFDRITSIRDATNEDVGRENWLSSEQKARRDKRKHKWTEHAIWYHGEAQFAFQEGYESEYMRKVDVDSLQEEAIKYLRRPWMENEDLERIVTDALMFATVTAFGEELKQYAPGVSIFGLNLAYFSAKGNIMKMMWKRTQYRLTAQIVKVAVFLGVPIAAGWYFFNKGYQDWVVLGGIAYGTVLAVVVLYKVLRRLFRGKPKSVFEKYDDYLELLGELWVTYDLLKGRVVSPTLLKERLLDAAKKGAVWPGAIFSILDHAIQRNPAVWGASDESAYRG
jgi:hypothetical protein